MGFRQEAYCSPFPKGRSQETKLGIASPRLQPWGLDEGLALTEIDEALTVNGFNTLEPAIYCGRDGSVHEQVGERTWLVMQWHKMETGKYEVNAYVS